ncbi:MAG TPA: SAM-dependent chlorinase/fluorinase [Microbacterium sp.]|nr:SAM-dependent chlorinase/fluorinase [Microbacterium sp.]
MSRITILTDFGTADGYVAAMKGVIADIAPGAVIDDASHDIPPGDVEAAAFALSRYWRLYPAGTVHLVVVDPGVGSERRAIAARVDGRFFVAPDNGVLTRVLDEAAADRIVSIEDPAYTRGHISATFHGRDIFAPAAAHLARGTPLDALGPAVADPVRLPLPRPERTEGTIHAHVVAIDRFGNLITDVPGAWLSPGARVVIEGRDIGPLRRTYADVGPGQPLALVGSTGMLEISVRDGSAATMFDAARGTPVIIQEDVHARG